MSGQRREILARTLKLTEQRVLLERAGKLQRVVKYRALLAKIKNVTDEQLLLLVKKSAFTVNMHKICFYCY